MAAKFGLLINAKTKGENNIKRLGNSMQGVEGKAKNLGMAVRGVGTAFKALFAAAAVGGFASVVKGAIDSADSFQKLEVRTGIAAEKLMAYVEAGKLADVSQKQLEVGLKTLARTQVEAADGVATYADTYSKLGIDVKKANGDLKPTDQLLGEIADRFADLPDGPEKAAAALDLFGKSGVDMITMLNGGSAALEEFNFGLSGEFAQNAAFYNDEVTKLTREFNKFKLQLVDALLPALTQITQSFATLFDEGTNLEPLFMVIAGSIRVVAGVVFATIKLVDVLIKNAVTGVQIIGKVLTGDFAGAIELGKQRFTGFVEQAKKDFQELANIATGTATAPAGYTRSTAGTGLLDLPEKDKPGKEKGTKEDKPVVQVSAEVLRLTKQINEAKLEGNKLAEVDLGYDLAIQQLREKGVTGNNYELQQNNLLTQYTLDRLNVVQAMGEAQDDLNDKTNKYKVTLEQVKDVLADQLTSAITGLIDGTKSLKESLSGLLKSFGQMFLRAGMQGLVGNIFPSAKGNAFAQNKIVPYANGGLVSRPTLALMGEAGAEAVLPLKRGANGQLGVQVAGADMNAAMGRYARRGSGAAIATDDAAAMAGAEGGGGTIDVSYSVERINNVNYVSAEEFERGMAQAAKRGAELGRQGVYSDLVNKRSVRSRVGV